MIQVRRNVFETNSSSTHSIALTTEGPTLYTDKEIADSFVKIGALLTPGAFVRELYDDGRTLNLATIPEAEWSFQRNVGILDDFANKTLYALLSYKNDKLILPAIYRFLLKRLALDQVILPFFMDKYDDELQLGVSAECGIDHDSTSALAFALGASDNKYSLMDFLNRKDIVVLLDQEG